MRIHRLVLVVVLQVGILPWTFAEMWIAMFLPEIQAALYRGGACLATLQGVEAWRKEPQEDRKDAVDIDSSSAERVDTASVAGLESVETGRFTVGSLVAQASPSLWALPEDMVELTCGVQKVRWKMTTCCSGAHPQVFASSERSSNDITCRALTSQKPR